MTKIHKSNFKNENKVGIPFAIMFGGGDQNGKNEPFKFY